MAHPRRWLSIALSGLVAVSLCLGASSRALAASMGPASSGPTTNIPEVSDWNFGGSLDVGGMLSTGDRASSSKYQEYRDMDNGFLGEFSLKGEHKEEPYFFNLYGKNPSRDDQLYEGSIGRYGLFRLDLGWDRTPHDYSNNAATIFQLNGSTFNLPASLRNSITTTPAGFVTGVAANCGATVSWTCPYPVGSNTAPTRGNAQFNFIQNTINGLLRPVDLSTNTDVGTLGLRFTPTEALRFDIDYSNRHVQGFRAAGGAMQSIAGGTTILVSELGIPIDQMTNEVKFGAGFSKPNYGLQFNYTASIFTNEYSSYTWDNPQSTVTQLGLTSPAGVNLRSAAAAMGQFSAAPDNIAQTFNLTGRTGLPWWRTNISANGSYTLLRQDQTFLNNIASSDPTTAPYFRNTDDGGKNNADARSNLLSGNVLVTSRPINNVTVTGKYRYFEYQNDMSQHVFTNVYAPAGTLTLNQGTGQVSAAVSTLAERYTKQNGGIDVGWRPIQQLSFKGGYEYEHWNRGDFDESTFSTAEHIARAAVDTTPVDWFLGRLTYTYGVRYLNNYGGMDLGSVGSGPQFFKFNYADRVRNRADVLLQFTPWQTLTPSLTAGYANDNYWNSIFGLTDDTDYNAGVSLTWTPLEMLTLTADYTYEIYDYKQAVAGNNTGTAPQNNWKSQSTDQYHILSFNGTWNVIPKKFDINFGYAITYGDTKIKTSNFTAAACPAPGTAATCAYNYSPITNTLQTFKILARYKLTERLSVRGGFAYERFAEKNFLTDPMQPFIGNYDTSAAGIQSTFLGATVPNYEVYIFSGFIRYAF